MTRTLNLYRILDYYTVLQINKPWNVMRINITANFETIYIIYKCTYESMLISDT